MIVIRLQGGLGNQMFQYAYGRELVSRGYEVVYDPSVYAGAPSAGDPSESAHALARDYELAVWGVDLPWLKPADSTIRPRRYGGLGAGAWLAGRRPLRKLRERPQGFAPQWLAPPRHAYLIGYWQGERFFPSVANEMRRVFRPGKPLSKPSKQALERIQGCNSIAVHVRRTDYLTCSMLQVCDETFQRRCVEELLRSQPDGVAFVFSDDVAWCRQNLRLPCETCYVEQANGEHAWQDLWLMSRCRHQVIANSSFGWWAAWLKEDREGAVYAPTPWAKNPQWRSEDMPLADWSLRPGSATLSGTPIHAGRKQPGIRTAA